MHALAVLEGAHFTRTEVAHIDLAGSTGGMLDKLPAAALYLVTDGSLWLSAPDTGQVMRMFAGDVAFLPGGACHMLQSEPGSPMLRPQDLIQGQVIRNFGLFRHGEGPLKARFIGARCTWDGCTAATLPLALPPVMLLRGALHDSAASIGRHVSLIEAEVARARSASRLLVSRLLDTLTADIIATMAESPRGANLVQVAGKPAIARALRCIDASLARNWTVPALATEVGMSRSAFVAHFTRAVGMPPAGYIAERRLARAARLLRQHSLTVAQVADAVGYGSPAAFITAFRRRFGAPPARWRYSEA